MSSKNKHHNNHFSDTIDIMMNTIKVNKGFVVTENKELQQIITVEKLR